MTNNVFIPRHGRDTNHMPRDDSKVQKQSNAEVSTVTEKVSPLMRIWDSDS
jgi:hypothetical protein